jgi:hypothetical protein
MTIQDQSISMNDDNGQITNKNEHMKTLDKSSSHNSKRLNTHNDYINKTSSTSNVLSRLMHSELHVQKRTAAAYDLFFYPIAAIALAY